MQCMFNCYVTYQEDFQYNITLLEARDEELSRLDSLANSLAINLENKENDTKSLSNRIDQLHTKDMERNEKSERFIVTS